MALISFSCSDTGGEGRGSSSVESRGGVETGRKEGKGGRRRERERHNKAILHISEIAMTLLSLLFPKAL